MSPRQAIIIFIVVAMSVFSSCLLGAIGFMLIRSGVYSPDWLPNSMRYQGILDAKLIGTPAIITYSDQSKANCLNKCSENVGCLSVVHNPNKKICKLYPVNAQIDPDAFSGNWEGTNYFEKNNFWSRFTPGQPGTMDDVAGLDINHEKVASAKDCAYKCLKQAKDPKCQGFNYIPSRQQCEILGTGLHGNEYLIDSTDEGSYYGLMPILNMDQTNQVIDSDDEPTKDTFM